VGQGCAQRGRTVDARSRKKRAQEIAWARSSWGVRSDETERAARGREGGGRGGRTSRGTERTMGWRGRAFWNGKLFLVGRRRPSWAKKEQAIYISKQPSLKSHPLASVYGKSHHFSFSDPIQSSANYFIDRTVLTLSQFDRVLLWLCVPSLSDDAHLCHGHDCDQTRCKGEARWDERRRGASVTCQV